MTDIENTDPKADAPKESAPDRLCNDSASPFYNEALLERGIGILFNGAEKTNVEEYCISEGWVKVATGKARDRRGNPMTFKLKGEVKAWLK